MANFFAAAAAGSACRTPQSAAGVKITNGIEVTPGADTDPFPAVVQIRNEDVGGRCTATFIRARIAATAAHCIGSGEDGAITFGEVRAVHVYHLGLTGHDAELTKKDLALVEFGDNVAPAVMPLLGRLLTTENVVLVGFGRGKALAAATANVKRYGANQIQKFENGLPLILGATGQEKSPTAKAGEDSASAAGDSGGPAVVEGSLAGVISGGSVDAQQRKRTLLIDWASPEGLALLAKLPPEKTD